MDEEEARKQRLRERMARLAGGGQGGAFNPFGMPGPAPSARKAPPPPAKERDETPSSPQERRAMPQMIAIPGMGGAPPPPKRRDESPASALSPAQRSATEPMSRDEDDENEDPAPLPPPRASTERSAAPAVPKGKTTSRWSIHFDRKPLATISRADSVVVARSRANASPPDGVGSEVVGLEYRSGARELRNAFGKAALSSSILYSTSGICLYA